MPPTPIGISNSGNSHAILDPTNVGVPFVISVSQLMYASASNASGGLVRVNILNPNCQAH